MTRRLPWLEDSRPLVVRSSQSSSPVTPRSKRRRILEPNLDIDQKSEVELSGRNSPDVKSSPPPAFVPHSERMMEEGLDKDDRYRMVEDEFMDAAKQFTQHLHAAEYRRLKKAAKSQNAATISSIFRPVTIKMSDETRRKVASVTKARKQAATLQSLLGKQGHSSGSEEDSDDHRNVWVGTALHSLMKSPRKATPSLARFAEITAATGAAKSFQRPQRPKPTGHSPPLSVSLKRYSTSEEYNIHNREAANDVSDDDDDNDLDAVIRPRPALTYTNPGKAENLALESKCLDSLPDLDTKQMIFAEGSVEVEDSHQVDFLGESISSRRPMNVRQRIAKRLEQSKLQDVRKQQEARKRLEIIPTFLS